jgi:ankyrin repeat protein
MNGDVEEIKFLIKEEIVNVNERTFVGTALDCAIENYALVKTASDKFRAKEIVEYLIKNGADVNGKTRTGNGNTHLHEAIRDNCLELVEILVKNGADINKSRKVALKKISPLQEAVNYNRIDLVELLIRLNADTENLKVKDQGLKIQIERWKQEPRNSMQIPSPIPSNSNWSRHIKRTSSNDVVGYISH